MKYIINSKIVFSVDEGTLSVYESAETPVKLSKPACRLLLELIKKNNHSVSRDELLQRVWINYSPTASNAGLNNYIREIRKALLSIGMDNNIIVTIPKLGFKLEGEIQPAEARIQTPEPENAVEIPLVPHTEDTVVEQKNHEIVVTHTERKHFFSWRQPLVVSLILIISLCAFFTFSHNGKPNLISYSLIQSVDNCDIYSIGKVRFTPSLLADLMQAIKKEGVDCLKNKNDIFYMEDRIGESVPRVSLISICDKHQGSNYDHCFSMKKQRNIIK
ncbi:winged helix-turn-helix domain-containing protein [Serratia entomophila]|uniref:Winged helix-turn-helix domain-containing protein n=1 Tax=Serratia entomophila TaxID=42906 RepID=A0ABY5CUF3_9GAMM|nr:winged helix-turn-helix domain-containing protein [Serratia entomophila]USV01073.1 winged helix-turn-helix domain-containing protein [Serratia entomophila]CAI0979983.1 DNA-binding transcriptional activator CadC [Serratia entomophila]CAI1057806.1 DNA-binding transcriptional activator CadC [Serratia entomophila]CAI1058592.1 DNA-binding transcriptional activator CadC [Serratia entomophila]CAI1062903.1 DNA-binding transcriptional activator CadC [Serratia entomophila]